MATKKCQRCKKDLELTLFNESTRSKDGVASKCKVCAEKALVSYYNNKPSTRVSGKNCLQCLKENAVIQASFGYQKANKKISCSRHRILGMIDLVNKNRGCIKCAELSLPFKLATFGFEKNNKKIACRTHKTIEMIDLVHKNNGCIECAELGLPFKRATFGFEKDNKKIACSNHKTIEMIDLVDKNRGCIECAELGLPFKQAAFGYEKDNKKIACSNHKTIEMTNLVNKNRGCIECAELGLPFKQAAFGYEKDNKKIACSTHKNTNMINLAAKNHGCLECAELSLPFKVASFGFAENNKKIACSTHKTIEMIDLVNKNRGCIECAELGLPFKLATFGFETDNKKIACRTHKTIEMTNLVNKNRGCIECAELGLPFKQAAFGFEDNKKIACSTHKTIEMIDLVNKNKGCIECAELGLPFKLATFGFEKDNKKIVCSTHKTIEMIDLVNKNKSCLECAELGFPFKQATFGFEKDNKKIACSTHKTIEMIDLIHKGCISCAETGLFKTASFGRLFEPKIHCKAHAKPNEYSKNQPKCEECFERPFYGVEKIDAIPLRCEEHKKDGDIDMLSQKCTVCGDDYFIPSTQTKCNGCLGWSVRKEFNKGLKERKIEAVLKQIESIAGKPVHDKIVTNGCTRSRPDFYYENFCPAYSLIVEVDEHQHSKYACSIWGEMTRIIRLFEEDSGGFPLCFIRFNPDPYYSKTGALISQYRGREETLITTIKNMKNMPELEHSICVIYLYYDAFETVQIRPLTYEIKEGILYIKHDHPMSNKKIHKQAI